MKFAQFPVQYTLLSDKQSFFSFPRSFKQWQPHFCPGSQQMYQLLQGKNSVQNQKSSALFTILR